MLIRHSAPRTYSRKMDAERWLSDEQWLIERGEWTSPASRTAARKAKAITVADYVAGSYRAAREHQAQDQESLHRDPGAPHHTDTPGPGLPARTDAGRSAGLVCHPPGG